MTSSKILKTAAIASIMTVGALMSAQAQSTTVTLNPTAAGIGTEAPFQATNYNLADFATIIINNSTGAFTQSGTLNLTSFLNGSTSIDAPVSGLRDGNVAGSYGLYLTFTASGTLPGFATASSASTITGSFSSISYNFVGDPGNTDTVSRAGVLTDSGTPDITLATGGLAAGGRNQATLTAGIPSADVLLTLLPTAPSGTSFFQAPASLNLQEDSFTNTSSVISSTTITNSDGTTSTVIDINGGGGNGTFAAAAAPIPEPASLALLGAGLVGVGIARKRKTHV